MAPTYNALRVLGSLCYATNTLPSEDKFPQRAHPCIFLSYPLDTKGYTLLDLTSQTIFHSCDVSFREHIFYTRYIPLTLFLLFYLFLFLPLLPPLLILLHLLPSFSKNKALPLLFTTPTHVDSHSPFSSPKPHSPPQSSSLPSPVALSIPLR